LSHASPPHTTADATGHWAVNETSPPAGLKKVLHTPPTTYTHTLPADALARRYDANGHLRAWEDSGGTWHWVGDPPPP